MGEACLHVVGVEHEGHYALRRSRMPVLDINLEEIATTLFKIQAVMLYPDDPEERQRYVRLHQGLHATQKPQQRAPEYASLDRTLLKDLYKLKEPERQKRHAQGRIAGGILVLIKQLQDHDVEEGVNKAIHMIIQWRKAGDLVCPIPTGRTSLQHYWSHFKPVVHLWADVYLRKRHVFCKPLYTQTSPEEIVAFLARAEWFRRFGEQHIPKRSNPPLPTLSPQDTWRVSGEAPFPAIDVKIPRLTGRQRQCLETYLHPKLYFNTSKKKRPHPCLGLPA